MVMQNGRPEILSGPEVKTDGTVAFIVRVGNQTIEIAHSPLGLGPRDEITSLELVNAAMHAVHDWTDAHAPDLTAYYREAGRRRQAAGNPPLIDLSTTADVQLQHAPKLSNDSALFQFRTAQSMLNVYLCADGIVCDHCDDWDLITAPERAAASAAAVNYALRNLSEMESLGVDAGMIRDIWG